MKVYIITTSSFPYGMADTHRLRCYAKAIIAENIPCEIVVYKRNSGFDNRNRTGTFEGIPYFYTGITSIRSNKGIFSRINDVRDRMALFRYLKGNLKSGDVVFCYGSLYSRLIPRLVHKLKAKFVCNLTEYPFLFSKKSIFRKLYKNHVENNIFPLYDGIIAISDELLKYAQDYTSLNTLTLKVPILVEYDKFYLEDLSEQSSSKFIFHAGSLLESKDGILGMIEAFGKYKEDSHSDVKFYSTGVLNNSPHAPEMKHLIDKYNLSDDVIFLGFLSEKDYHLWLQKASLVIINKKNTLQNKYCFSTKLGEYMAAGKTIIITEVGEAMNWLTDGKDAVVIEPENIDSMSHAISILMHDNGLRRTLGEEARNTCKTKFDYRIYGKPIVQFFFSLINNKIAQ